MAKIIGYIYRPYITVKGKRIRPKHAKCFRIPIKKKTRANESSRKQA